MEVVGKSHPARADNLEACGKIPLGLCVPYPPSLPVPGACGCARHKKKLRRWLAQVCREFIFEEGHRVRAPYGANRRAPLTPIGADDMHVSSSSHDMHLSSSSYDMHVSPSSMSPHMTCASQAYRSALTPHFPTPSPVLYYPPEPRSRSRLPIY